MADFMRFYEVLVGHEGGYVFDPEDPGGETYHGVARGFHPNWPGWALVDEYKTKPGFPSSLNKDKRLQKMVQDFFKEEFWDPFGLDRAPDELAWEMFDIGVNMGKGRLVEFMQEIFNTMNNRGTRWPDVKVDRVLGGNTNKAWKSFNNECEKREYDPQIVLARMLNLKQGQQYFENIELEEYKEKYAWGWFGRVISYT